MAIVVVGYRPPTDDEVRGYIKANFPNGYLIQTPTQITRLPSGNVIVWSEQVVLSVHPEFNAMSPADRLAFLDTPLAPGGVLLRIPLQPVTQNVPDQPPPPPPPVILPPPVSPTTIQTTTAPSVALSNFLRISNQSVHRTYRKDSMTPLDSETLTLQNISQDLPLTVAFEGANGIIFAPVSLLLQPQETKTVEISFDTAIIQTLQEGLSAVKALVGLTSKLQFTQLPQQRVVQPTLVPVNEPEPDPPIVKNPDPPLIINNPTFRDLPIHPPRPVPIPIDTGPGGPRLPPFIPITRPALPVPNISTWVNGLDGTVNEGNPPDGWYYDSTIGGWLPVVSDVPPAPEEPTLDVPPPLEPKTPITDLPSPSGHDGQPLPDPIPTPPSGGGGGGSTEVTNEFGDTEIHRGFFEM